MLDSCCSTCQDRRKTLRETRTVSFAVVAEASLLSIIIIIIIIIMIVMMMMT